MRISDWSSDVCSSDLIADQQRRLHRTRRDVERLVGESPHADGNEHRDDDRAQRLEPGAAAVGTLLGAALGGLFLPVRSEEHTSELQSLMRTSYAVFCLKKNTLETYEYT